MKTWIKKGLVTLASTALLFGIAACGNEEANNIDNAESESNGQSTMVEDGIVTEVRMHRIEEGMSIEEVQTIMGTDGEIVSKNGETVVYFWKGGEAFGKGAEFTFTNGNLTKEERIN